MPGCQWTPASLIKKAFHLSVSSYGASSGQCSAGLSGGLYLGVTYYTGSSSADCPRSSRGVTVTPVKVGTEGFYVSAEP